MPTPHKSTMDGFNGAIISLGPETDGLMKKYGFPDTFIPCLHVLSRQVRSSDWQSTLRSRDWGLTLEQLTNIAKAMEHDIMGKPGLQYIKVEHVPDSLLSLQYLFIYRLSHPSGESCSFACLPFSSHSWPTSLHDSF